MVEVSPARILLAEDEPLDVDRTTDLAAIVLTAAAADNNLNACYALGISSHAVKPLDFETAIAASRCVGLHWLLLPRTPLPSSSA